MSNRYLVRLRVARVRCNENIARLESSLAFQRSHRDALEGGDPRPGAGAEASGAEPEA